MFRNVRLYRVRADWPATEEILSDRLATVPFSPCGSYTERSSGWEAPVSGLPELLARRVGGADLMRLRSQTRILPSAAINEALEDRILEFSSRVDRAPSRKEKRDLKDEVHAELLPRALLKSDRIWGMYLKSEGVLAVDTASEAQAERFLDQLRAAFGSLPVTPVEFAEPVGRLLTSIFLGTGPTAFLPGRECRMLDPAAGSASVTWMDIDLDDPSVQKHVRAGLTLDRLAVSFEDAATMVLDRDCVIRKLKLAGIDRTEEGDGLDEDPVGRLDAEVVLVAGVLTRLTKALARQLGGYD